MAYYYRALPTTAAGGLITLLDEILVLNANWSIWDAAAAANCKVYKCATAGSVFYFYVNDNQADFALVRIYEAWDAGAHTGSGTNTSATVVKWRKIGSTLFILNDTRLIYAHLGTNYNYNYYVGQLKRFDDSVNSPILVGCHTSGAGTTSPLAMGGTSGTATQWLLCRFDTAVVRSSYCFSQEGGYVRYWNWKSDRRWYVSENIVYQGTEALVIGQLDGVMVIGNSAGAAGAMQDKKITVNGVQWICWYDGIYGCFLRLD
jgi:hypothetical protein